MKDLTYQLHWLNYINPFFYIIIGLYYILLGLAKGLGFIYRKTKLRDLLHEVWWVYCLKTVRYDSQWCREVYKNVHKSGYDKAPKLRARIVKEACRMRLANIKNK